jgi:hypothetical protein
VYLKESDFCIEGFFFSEYHNRYADSILNVWQYVYLSRYED